MKSYLSLILLSAGAVLLIFSGCGVTTTHTSTATTQIVEGPSPGVRVENSPGGIAQVRMNSVAILDDSLQRWYVYENSVTGVKEHGKIGKIAVESTNTRRTPTNTIEAWALFRNRTDYDLQIQCRVQFFDYMKAPLEDPSAWKRIYLPANSVASYKESSIGVHDIGYYYIEVREGR